MMTKLIDIIRRNYMGLPTTPTEQLIYLGCTTAVMAGTALILRKLDPTIRAWFEAQMADQQHEDLNQAA